MVITETHAVELDTRLHTIERGMFRTAEKWKQALLETLQEDEYEHVLEQSKERRVNLTNRKDVQTFIAALRKELHSLPRIVIRLAFRPRQVFVEEIRSQLSRSGMTRGRISFVYDPGIIAGVVLEHGGIIYNRSAAKHINEELSTLS